MPQCNVWSLTCLAAAFGLQSTFLSGSVRLACALRRVSLSDKYSQGHPLAPSLQPVGAWQSPHNNSVLMVQLSQWGWAGGCGLKEPLAGGPGLRG